MDTTLEFSRRAIYKAQEWLADLPPRPEKNDETWREMVAAYLAYQFGRQGGIQMLARQAVRHVLGGGVRAALPAPKQSRMSEEARALEQLLVTSEFFARDMRALNP